MNYIATWYLLFVTQWHKRASSFTAMDPQTLYPTQDPITITEKTECIFSFLDCAFLRISFEFTRMASCCLSKQQSTLSGNTAVVWQASHPFKQLSIHVVKFTQFISNQYSYWKQQDTAIWMCILFPVQTHLHPSLHNYNPLKALI